MKNLFAGLILLLSLLVLSGEGPAFGQTSPPPPQLQLQQAPAQNDAQSGEIRDIKGPVPVPESSRFLIPVIAAVALILFAALVYFLLKRRRQPTPAAVMPDAVALTELDRARDLMNQPLLYAERISSILRLYIEARFQIRSTRQTTQEFFSRLKNGTTIAEVDIKNHAGDLQDCMEQCDVAKFAHGTPNRDSMVGMDQAVRNFIDLTRQKENPGAGIEKGRP